MNDILFDYLDDFWTAYLDDVLIYSEDEVEHQEHVQKVLARLKEADYKPISASASLDFNVQSTSAL